MSLAIEEIKKPERDLLAIKIILEKCPRGNFIFFAPQF
jgi:hypothetical protein